VDDAPVTIQELRMRMRQLHIKCGTPTAAAMRKSIKDFSAPRVAPASLSEFLSNKRPNALPKQDFLRGFVAACLLCRGAPAAEVTAELRTWDTWWAALVLASGAPPVTIMPRAPAGIGAEIGGGERPRPGRPISMVAGLVAGLAIGAGATITIPALFRAEDSYPHELRVEVGRPLTRPTPGGFCPRHDTAIRNGRAEPIGTVWYRECVDHLDVVITDNLADNYCIFSVIHWPNGQSTTTSRTCMAGHSADDSVPKPGQDFWMELVATEEG
jgi:hypothetical protein